MHVLNTTAQIEAIYHISDLHIKLLKQHDEYNTILQKFLHNINNKHNSAIAVTGDILHSKTELTPECIQLTRGFFSQASKLCPVFVICGVHDLNLTNKYRLDSLTPLLYDLPNVYYFSTAGIYQYGNLLFCPTTVRDKNLTIPPPTLNPLNNLINICMYYNTTNQPLDISAFKAFDIVLLGGSDTHKYQMLSDNIKFSPSLIQQNHSESLSGHGYIKWIWNWSQSHGISHLHSELCELENEYGYVTVEINNNNLIMPHKIPAKPRARFEITDTDSAISKKLITNFCTEYNVIEKVIHTKKSTNTTETNGISDKINLSQLDYTTLASKIIPVEKLPATLELMQHYSSLIDSSEAPKTRTWHLRVLEFANMFCYTTPVSINFMDYSGLTGIFGSNHSGKSSIIDIILYCLYDKCSRGERKEVLNYTKTDFFCSLEFQLDNTIYRICRNAKTIKGTLKIDAELWADGINISGKDRYETNAKIAELIGTYEDLTTTAISLQGQTNSFIELTHSNRKKLLNDIMRLDYYDKLYDLCNTDLKEVNADLKLNEKSFSSTKLANAQKVVTELESQLELDNKSLSEIQTKIDELQREKENLLRLIISDVPECDMTLEVIKEEISDIDKSLLNYDPAKINAEIKKESEIYVKALEQYNSKLTELRSEQAKLKQSIIQMVPEKYLIEQLNQWKTKYETTASSEFITREISFLNDIAEKLSVFDDDEDINYVKNQIDTRRKTICATSNSKIPLSLTQIIEQLQIINNNANAKIRNAEIEPHLLKISDELQHISKPLDKSIQLKEKLANLSELQLRKQDLYDCIQNHDQIKKNEQLNENINHINAQVAGLKLKHKKLLSNINTITSNISIGKSEIDKLLKLSSTIESLLAKQDKLKTFASTVNKDGIPSLILAEVIPFLQYKTNEIIALLTDLKITFVADGKELDIICYRADTDMSANILMASGYEKFVCSIAIRVAMMSLSMLPKPNFIIIDEGFGAFDADHLDSVNIFLEYLQSEFKSVLIISHIDVLKNDINQVILPDELKKQKAKVATKSTIQLKKKL